MVDKYYDINGNELPTNSNGQVTINGKVVEVIQDDGSDPIEAAEETKTN